MFQSITFNGTDKKQIGLPILRRTNEMIYEFDLQYEKNYKIAKVVSQRELDFKAYLKEQEALQFHLENLIKILRQYFKENNYNDNTYYNLFKYPKTNTNRKRRRKKRKKMRSKTAEIKTNKFLFYKVTKNNYYFIKFKPYLYPLTNKDRKEFERKIYTDVNLKEKETSKLYNMTPARLKKFVDVFGFLPVTLRKDGEDKDKNTKILKKNRNFSSYNIFRNKKSNSLGNKNQINLKKGVNNIFMKKESNFNNFNNFNNINNSNVYNNLINNFKLKLSKSMNLKNNKNNLGLFNNNFKNNNNKNINNNIFNILINNKLGLNPQINNNYNNIFNNRYSNLKHLNYVANNMKLNNSKMINNYNYNFLYNNNNNINNIYSSNNNMSLPNNKNNINNINITNDNKIKIKKNLNLENIKKQSFTNQCIRTIQKSEILNKDIKFLNKEYNISGQNFNIKKNNIENKTLQKVNVMSFIQIYEKDFMPDIKKQFEQKFEHIKEDNQGRIQVKKIEFLRKPKSKLNFVRIYNKRRDQKRLNKIEFVYNNNDEEKSDLTAYKMRRSLSNIKLSRNHLSKFKHINPASSMKCIN